VFVAGIFLFLPWRLVSTTLRDAAARDYVQLASLTLFVACVLTLGVVIIWGFLRPALTTFTDGGVSQWTSRGRISVRWDEITDVRETANGRAIELVAGSRVIRISPMIYSDWNSVFQWLTERLPPAAVQK
jgi:hypothetical protein